MSTPFRIQPAAPAAAYKTYAIRAPLATHFNVVTCADVDCPHYLLGWDSVIDEQTSLGQRQAHYVRTESGRKFTEERQPDGLTRFTFEAGQKCFQQHKARNMRPERYIERGGDWRGNPRGDRYEHTRADTWTESFAEHQSRLRAAAERG